MDRKLHAILEEIDSCLSEQIERLETLTPDLQQDSDAFIADDVRELMEDIRGVINEK
jgi:hypothetical protein